MESPYYFWPWNQPFYEGLTITELLGSGYHIAIAGRPYLVDPEQCERQFIKQLRAIFQDTSSQPGEHYLNPETAMRMSTGDWSHGEGQLYFDDTPGTTDPGSDRLRYRESQGVDPWGPRCFTLLPPTRVSYVAASGSSTLRMVSGVAAASGVYVMDDDGTTHRVTRSVNPNATVPTWTPCTGLVGTVFYIACDGINVYVVAGTAGATNIYRLAMPGTAFTVLTGATKAYVGCAYGNGRLFAWTSAGEMWEIGNTGTPTLVMAHRAGAQFTWTAVAGAPNATYLCGTLGQSTEIYRVDVSDATGALGAAVPALTVYDEAVRAAAHDSGRLVLGLAVEGGVHGDVRCCDIAQTGALTLGPQIVVGHTPYPVNWIDPAGRFVYFPWSGFDADRTGLGRVDLVSSTDSPLVYAYASDLMAGRTGAGVQGMVRGSAAYDGHRLFSVDGKGVYTDTDPTGAYDMVGYLSTGRIRFGMYDFKAFTSVECAWEPLPPGCTVMCDAAFDDGSEVNLFVIDVDGSTGPGGRVDLPHQNHHWVELTFTLSAPAGAPLGEPCFRWFIVRAVPATGGVERVLMAVRLHALETSSASDVEGTDIAVNVDYELDYLRELARTGRVVALQRADRSEDVYVKDVGFKPDRWSWDQKALEGIALVEMHTLE